jgi:hypothetical protein
MSTDIDFTNYDEIVERHKANPKRTLKKASLNDLRLVARASSQDVYSKLAEILRVDENEEALNLLAAFDSLTAFSYECDLDNFPAEEVKEIIYEVWPKLAKPVLLMP